MFREVEDLRAVGEERPAALTQIEPACIQFSERGNQAGGGVSLDRRQPLHFCQQFTIREHAVVSDLVRHTPLWHRRFHTARALLWRRFDVMDHSRAGSDGEVSAQRRVARFRGLRGSRQVTILLQALLDQPSELARHVAAERLD
jgi:hypothetical protein